MHFEVTWLHNGNSSCDKEHWCFTVACAYEVPSYGGAEAIGGKWSLICLYWLDSGTRRFNELHRLMPDISHKVLTTTLRGLENEGLICRTVYPEVPARVE